MPRLRLEAWTTTLVAGEVQWLQALPAAEQNAGRRVLLREPDLAAYGLDLGLAREFAPPPA